MGKGDRRHKRQKETPPGVPALATVPRPKKRGATRMRQLGQEAAKQTLARRVAQAGLAVNADNLAKARAPWFECEAGLALQAAFPRNEDAIRRLWAVLFDWRASEDRFLRRCMDRGMYPGRDSVPYLPEPLETRDDVDYDLRSPEEKATAARRVYNALCSEIKLLAEAEMRICFRGVWDANPGLLWYPEPFAAPRLTYDGAVFVNAIGKLADLLDGR